MKFIKKIDHLQLLKFALGVSLFSIGYLLTMFYFQMKELKDHKMRIEVWSNSTIQILHLKLDIESENYTILNQIFNRNTSVKKLVLDNKENVLFLKNASSIHNNDPEFLKRINSITNLYKLFQKSKNEIVKNNSNTNIEHFNTIVYDLNSTLNESIIFLESKISMYNNAYYDKIDNSKATGFLIALVSLVIFVLAYVKMNEDLIKLQKSNDDATFMNETLNNAEMVAGFGSWKINTVENKFIISDNFYRLLGLQPNSFIPSMDIIMSFIHPEDREEVLKLHKDSFNTRETTSILYRYLLQDGTIKHMVSVGKFLNNSKGELVKIGVNYDTTQLMIKSKELEDKNSRLVAINSELESFNNIVGHDLQEPLRKIQMFISRIESKEFIDSASETTIGYFGKIKIATQRMQNLMTDLVDYTRTIKDDRIFELIDLNTIFDEIREDLAHNIEEKNATILTDKLPTILGTKFQIQQLFINLISNALKYVKPGISPNIAVKLEDFSEDFVNEKAISGKDYFKITVTDNGIGFEQKYAEKIFMLFKRLETDQTYKGTGLGLAICKKIVDNNNGYLTAVGIPNQGSTFMVYLPKNKITS